MTLMNEVSTWIIQNKESITTIVLLLVTLLRMTSWGRANSQALDVLADSIERHGTPELKANIAKKALPNDVADAIKASACAADQQKPTPTKTQIFLREALKTFGLSVLDYGKKPGEPTDQKPSGPA